MNRKFYERESTGEERARELQCNSRLDLVNVGNHRC